MNELELDRKLRVAFFWLWFGVGIMLTFGSFSSWSSGYAATAFGIFFMIYGLWRTGRKLRASSVQPGDIAVIAFAVFVISVAELGTDSFIREHETNFAPLLTALEQYRDITGEYPDELDQLVPEYAANLPACPMPGKWARARYDRQQSPVGLDERYQITCTVGAFVFPHYGMYESGATGWVYNDTGVIF